MASEWNHGGRVHARHDRLDGPVHCPLGRSLAVGCHHRGNFASATDKNGYGASGNQRDCPNTNADADANTSADANTYSNTNANTDTNTDTNTYSHTDADANAYSHTYRDNGESPGGFGANRRNPKHYRDRSKRRAKSRFNLDAERRELQRRGLWKPVLHFQRLGGRDNLHSADYVAHASRCYRYRDIRSRRHKNCGGNDQH
jgi:hypothetical protein